MKKVLSYIKRFFRFIFRSYMKFIVLIIIIHGMICITMSYYLAYIGREVIAEELSKVVVQEIIAPTVIYGFKSLFENISKYNNWVKIIKGDDHERYLEDNPDSDSSNSNDSSDEFS